METTDYAFYAPSLHTGALFESDGGRYQTWSYFGRTLAVHIYAEINLKGVSYCGLSCNAYGRTYRRHYKDFPTDHSIKLRCASLIKHIESAQP